MKLSKKESDHQYYLENKDKILKQVSNWQKENRQNHRDYDKKWRQKNPTKQREAYLKRAYKLSLKEFEELKLIQEGRCAICLFRVKRLVIDHCHKTIKIRGLLCTTCNAGIGQFKDDIELLAKAIAYLKRHETT